MLLVSRLRNRWAVNRRPSSRAGGWRLAHLLVVALILPAAPAAQQQTPTPPPPPASGATTAASQPEQPTFRAGINFVRVDTIVTDRQGQPVTDLTATDFEITEDGKPQTIETFRFVRVDSAAPVETQRSIRTRADEEAAAANDNSRIFVFFLDDYHVRLGNSMAARKPLVEFIRTNLGANDLLAVMHPLTPLDAVTLTRDHDSIVRTIERFQGRKYNYEPKNATEQRYANYPAETVERLRRQVSLSALQGLAVKLGALREGRKAVIVLSEGYTAMLPPQLRDPVASMPGMGNAARRNPLIGENSIAEDRADMVGQMDVQQEMQEVFSAASRSNTALYTVDPRGLATGEFDISENVGTSRSNASLRQTQDTLRVLAEETDGRAIVNRNDLARAMKQIVADSSAYYLIGYSSTQAPQDGKFHEIKVRVKRPGTDVRARKGYWALSAADATRVTTVAKPGPPPAVGRALASISEPARGRLVRTWVGTSRGTDGKTRVTFVWEALPPTPGVKRETPTSVSLIAASTDGETYFRGEVPDPVTAAAAVAATTRPGATTTFEVPPGRLQLRMSINGAGGSIDSDDREVFVPDLTGAELGIGTPRVYIARTPREFQAISRDEGAVPTASREFRRTDRMVVRAETFAPGAAATTLTSRLLNKQGQKMADVPVTQPAVGPSSLIDLPLAALAPGEYLLELVAASEGLASATELIAFRLGS